MVGAYVSQDSCCSDQLFTVDMLLIEVEQQDNYRCWTFSSLSKPGHPGPVTDLGSWLLSVFLWNPYLSTGTTPPCLEKKKSDFPLGWECISPTEYTCPVLLSAAPHVCQKHQTRVKTGGALGSRCNCPLFQECDRGVAACNNRQDRVGAWQSHRL